MKKWLTYLFLLNACLGYSQPSSWKKIRTSDSIVWYFPSNFLQVNGMAIKPQAGDAISLFSKNVSGKYECVGLCNIEAADTLFMLPIYGKGGKDSVGFLTGQTYSVFYWVNSTQCYYRLSSPKEFPDSLVHYSGQRQIYNATGAPLSVGYPKASFSKSDVYANPMGDLDGVDSIQYVGIKARRLAIDAKTGRIDLASSDTGSYTINFITPTCLATNFFTLRISDTTKAAGILDSLVINQVPPTCTKGGEVIVHQNSIKGSPPYQFRLINTSSSKEWTNGSGIFDGLSEGVYRLEVTDSTNTTEIYHQPITLIRSEDCSNPVLAPDSKNGLETMYIDAQGSAKILDREGKVVKEMSVPNNWDGSDNTGKALPMGDYYLFVNGSQSKVITIIR